MAAPASPSSPSPFFFTSTQLSEVLGGSWVVADGVSPQRNTFINAPEAACTDALRIIYKKEDVDPNTPTAAIVHNVLISQHHQGARTMFLAITEKFKDMPLGLLTPLNLFPGLQPLQGATAAIDGRWIDPATTSALATYEYTKRLEDGSEVKQAWAFLSSIGKTTCHQYIVDADDKDEILRKLVLATARLN